MNGEAAQVIARHQLQPLPQEGGFFRRTWISPETVPGSAGRPTGTAILYLMTSEAFSALHAMDADELWRFQAGDPVEHVCIDPSSGAVRTKLLGPDPRQGHESQVVVPTGAWQGARPLPGGPRGWSLIAATCTPGWDPAGFVLGEPNALRGKFPGAAECIGKFSR